MQQPNNNQQQQQQPSQQRQRSDSVDGCPPAPPPTPAPVARNSMPILSAQPGQPSFTMTSTAVAAGIIAIGRHHANSVDSSQSSIESDDSIGSAIAILEGVVGDRPNVPSHMFATSRDTLESLWPFVPESAFDDDTEEAKKDFADKARALYDRLKQWVNRLLPFLTKGKKGEKADKIKYISFEDVLAAQQAAREAQAAAAGQQIDGDDGDNNNNDEARAITPPRVPQVVVQDINHHNEQLRLKGRGSRAKGFRVREWDPSLHMYDPDYLPAPVHPSQEIPRPGYPARGLRRPADDGRPADCPCGNTCVCITNTTPYPGRAFEPLAPSSRERYGQVAGMRFRIICADGSRPALPPREQWESIENVLATARVQLRQQVLYQQRRREQELQRAAQRYVPEPRVDRQIQQELVRPARPDSLALDAVNFDISRRYVDDWNLVRDDDESDDEDDEE